MESTLIIGKDELNTLLENINRIAINTYHEQQSKETFFTVSQASKFCEVNEKSIRYWVTEGVVKRGCQQRYYLNSTKKGKSVLITKYDLICFLNDTNKKNKTYTFSNE
ncbi:hypothetical protein [Tenacibaculum sp. nBUS_03]|uniref:hypothetical protein n=1 Tax=Tenacibaculum sp. nBUS_03 TaxID=3395320 RepID=UPI003EBA8EAD